MAVKRPRAPIVGARGGGVLGKGLLGIYLSVKLDLPTGATMVCTFGAVLIVMASLRRLWGRRTV